MKFVYAVDRIDEFENKRIVVVDYKTGGSDVSPKRLAVLKEMEMNHSSIKDTLRSFQLPLYYYFVSKEFSESQVNAELYNLRTLERKAFISENMALSFTSFLNNLDELPFDNMSEIKSQ